MSNIEKGNFSEHDINSEEFQEKIEESDPQNLKDLIKKMEAGASSDKYNDIDGIKELEKRLDERREDEGDAVALWYMLNKDVRWQNIIDPEVRYIVKRILEREYNAIPETEKKFLAEVPSREERITRDVQKAIDKSDISSEPQYAKDFAFSDLEIIKHNATELYDAVLEDVEYWIKKNKNNEEILSKLKTLSEQLKKIKNRYDYERE